MEAITQTTSIIPNKETTNLLKTSQNNLNRNKH